jgi:hypothetical protein
LTGSGANTLAKTKNLDQLGRVGWGEKVEEKIDMFRTNTRIFRSPKPKTSIFKQRNAVVKI